jgi:plastocyanin
VSAHKRPGRSSGTTSTTTTTATTTTGATTTTATTTTTAATTTTAQPPGGAAAGSTVAVTATEFALGLPTTHLTPGTWTFVLTNRGTLTHALEIEGGGLDEDADPVGPGGTTSMTVTLPAGTYTLYCPEADHDDRGMEVTLTVG